MGKVGATILGGAEGFATGGPVGAVAGAVGGDIAANQSQAQTDAANSAAAAAQSSTNAQNQLITQGELPIYQGQLANFNNNYQPLEEPTSLAYDDMLGSLNSNAGTLATNFDNLLQGLSSPSGADANSGIPVQQLMQNLIGYDSNPGGMLGSAQNVGGQALQFDLNQAQNGLDPAVQAAALQTQSTQDEQQMNTLISHLGAALPNVAGSIRDMDFNSDLSRNSLLTQLTAQDQSLRSQGMQNALSTAGAIDTQTQNSLANAANAGGNYSQQVLTNQGTANGTAVSNLGDVASYVAGGNSSLPGIADGLGQVASVYGANASTAAANASNLATTANSTNPFMTLASTIASNSGSGGGLSSLFGGGGGAAASSGGFQATPASYGAPAAASYGADTSYTTLDPSALALGTGY